VKSKHVASALLASQHHVTWLHSASRAPEHNVSFSDACSITTLNAEHHIRTCAFVQRLLIPHCSYTFVVPIPPDKSVPWADHPAQVVDIVKASWAGKAPDSIDKATLSHHAAIDLVYTSAQFGFDRLQHSTHTCSNSASDRVAELPGLCRDRFCGSQPSTRMLPGSPSLTGRSGRHR